MLTQDHIAETGKANLHLIFEVGTKAAEDLGKLAALNKRAVRSAPRPNSRGLERSNVRRTVAR